MFERISSALGARPAAISHAEMRARQARLLEQIPTDAVVIITNNPSSTRSADVHHRHRVNSYLLYLTGWTEEEGVAAFHFDGDAWQCRLYVQPRDILMETWEGRRPGVEGAKADWPVDEVVARPELAEDLGKLIRQKSSIYHVTGLDAEVDALVHTCLTEHSRARQRFGTGPTASHDPRAILDEMRLCKTDAEIALMQHAADLAAHAHMEAMHEAAPGMGEWQMQAIIEGAFLHHRSHWSYPSIVGSGDNATILHYNENDDVMQAGDLVLIDAGCEIDGYASDITRTFPVDGKFTEAQRTLYELVLKSQKAAIEACVVGAPYSAPHDVVCEILTAGLRKLGIIAEDLDDEAAHAAMRQFFMHGTGHWLGLDVHDVGIYFPNGEEAGARTFQPGMVVTIEPGLYFGAWREDIEIDAKWAGIGIRIEDDILITESGPVNLTAACIKEIDEIESLMAA